MRLFTSSDAIGRLYQDGVVVSRERVADLSDLLFGSNVRRQGGHRRFTEEQLRIVRAAAVLRNLGVGVEELRELVEGGGEDIARELRARIALLDESVEALRGLKLRTA